MEIFLLLHQLHLLKIWQLKLADGHVVTTVVTDLHGILLHGLGSKRTLLEDFRKTMLSDLSQVVVNGYFPSLTIKHVSIKHK